VDAGVAGIFERRGRRVALAVHQAYEGLGGEIVAAGDARLLVRVAVGNELAVCGDDQRVALFAHADLIDHSPHLFEADLADERAGALADLGQLDADNGGWQEVVVDADRRERDVLSEAVAGLWELEFRPTDAARGDLITGRVVEADFAELGKVEDGVFENSILLPLSKVRVRQIPCNRLKNIDVGLNVQTNLFGNSPRYVLVTGDH